MASELPPEMAAPVPPQYEFTDEQNRVIEDLATKMRLVGTVLQVFGVLGIITGLVGITHHGAGTLIQGVIFLFLGIWAGRSAAAFQLIAKTHGRDVSHLMEALRQLGKYFGLQYTLIMIGLLLLFCVLIAMLIMLVVGAGVSVFK